MGEPGSGVDTITFDGSLFGGWINIASQLPAITQAVAITGPGADLLTIDANGTSRIFDIDDGTASQIEVQLRSISLTGGDVTGVGGASSSRENLTVTSSTLSGNAASSRGGGIFNLAGVAPSQIPKPLLGLLGCVKCFPSVICCFVRKPILLAERAVGNGIVEVQRIVGVGSTFSGCNDERMP